MNHPARTGSYILRVRWEKAEASLQRAWDADNRRSTEKSAYRVQRAWDAAQRAKHLYEKAIGSQVEDGYHDGYEPTEDEMEAAVAAAEAQYDAHVNA